MHTIYVVVDSGDSIPEKSEDNNMQWQTVYVNDYADLQVNIEFEPAGATEGDRVEVNVTVWNAGESPASDVIVRLFLNDGTQVMLYNRTVNSLASNDSYTLQPYSWIAPATGGPASYSFHAVVDPLNETVETNEDNNDATASIGVNVPDIELHVLNISFGQHCLFETDDVVVIIVIDGFIASLDSGHHFIYLLLRKDKIDELSTDVCSDHLE
jgi:subtilase family serine protease